MFEEKAYLVGVARKGDTDGSFGIEESLNELEQLADTAGLSVVGSTYQKWVIYLSWFLNFDDTFPTYLTIFKNYSLIEGIVVFAADL